MWDTHKKREPLKKRLSNFQKQKQSFQRSIGGAIVCANFSLTFGQILRQFGEVSRERINQKMAFSKSQTF
jgi:hypothetical protein